MIGESYPLRNAPEGDQVIMAQCYDLRRNMWRKSSEFRVEILGHRLVQHDKHNYTDKNHNICKATSSQFFLRLAFVTPSPFCLDFQFDSSDLQGRFQEFYEIITSSRRDILGGRKEMLDLARELKCINTPRCYFLQRRKNLLEQKNAKILIC